MDKKKTISVMIPCYNEEDNARPIYEAVRQQLLALPYDYEILFIDNKSKDRTREIIRSICAEDKRVKAIFNVKISACSIWWRSSCSGTALPRAMRP